MPMNTETVEVDPTRFVECIEDAILQVVRGETQVILDISALQRLDAAGLKGIEKLVEIAEAKGVRPIVRGARVEAYKVLKLLGLANRLTYEPPDAA
jgi:anti-anti-sigma regulatory factor